MVNSLGNLWWNTLGYLSRGTLLADSLVKSLEARSRDLILQHVLANSRDKFSWGTLVEQTFGNLSWRNLLDNYLYAFLWEALLENFREPSRQSLLGNSLG